MTKFPILKKDLTPQRCFGMFLVWPPAVVLVYERFFTTTSHVIDIASARGRVCRRPPVAVVLWLSHRGGLNRSPRVYRCLSPREALRNYFVNILNIDIVSPCYFNIKYILLGNYIQYIQIGLKIYFAKAYVFFLNL
jgi:hypothetical protein